MNIFRKLLTATISLTLLIGGVVNADELANKGVVVSKNEAFNTITVRDNDTGTRDTYFIGESTELNSTGGPISFSDINAGQAVTLKFRDTDNGREVNTFDIGRISDVVDIVPVTLTDYYTIKGEITGTRPVERTITILPEGKSKRFTINVPVGTDIVQNGRSAKISDLSKGQTAEFKYRETDTGYMLVTDTSAFLKPETKDATPKIASYLPDTASNHFAWLLISMLLLLAGLGLRTVRSNAS